jgi:penicillin-binding protein-related factor A (putative recombinase)
LKIKDYHKGIVKEREKGKEKVKEAQAQVLFRDHNTLKGVFELKLAKTSSILFSAVKPHQKEYLTQISGEKGMFYKIPDSPIFSGNKTRFGVPKPFDCFNLSNIPAYVVICFYQPRKYKKFFYITIRDFLCEEEMSERKSLTMERAMEISEHFMEA